MKYQYDIKIRIVLNVKTEEEGQKIADLFTKFNKGEVISKNFIFADKYIEKGKADGIIKLKSKTND